MSVEKRYVSPKVIFSSCGDVWIFGSGSSHTCRFGDSCENTLEELYLCGKCRDNYIEMSYIQYIMYTEGVVPVCSVCRGDRGDRGKDIRRNQKIKRLLSAKDNKIFRTY
jgi:hypothetical protein